MNTLYGPWPDGARRTYGWATLPITFGFYVLSSLPVLVGTTIFMSILLAEGQDQDTVTSMMTNSTLGLLMPLLLVQFLIWGWLTRLWVRRFERRGPADLGLTGQLAFPRYVIGGVLGIVLVLFVAAAGAFLAGEGVEEAMIEPDFSDLVLPPMTALLGLCFIASVFLIQGAVEEYVFRGWMMSVLAERWGLWVGVFGSTLIFGLFHLHVFTSGVAFGLVAMTGITLTGLVFALICVLTKKLYEAMAAHGLFNAAAVGLPSFFTLAQNPERTLDDVFAEVLSGATGTAGPDASVVSAASFAQIAVMASVSVVLLILIRLKHKARHAD